ncbi:MAG: hypothetical protein RJA44_2766 [Pseudomonadota bacterium]
MSASLMTRSRRLLILISTGLVLAFSGIAWVQMSALALLRNNVQYQADSLLWGFTQLETEYLRLREALRLLQLDPRSTSLDNVQLRYELFVSRVRELSPQQTNSLTKQGELGRHMMVRLEEFIAVADQMLSEEATRPPTQTELGQLLEMLDPMAADLRDLTLDANHTEAERVARGNEAVERQYRLAIGLTLFQSLMTLAFAVVVMRQLDVQERRRQALEELAEHLREARAAAESSSQAKSAFLANMSHELRTPFNGLLGMLSLLQASSLTPRQLGQLRTARESGEHLLSILNDVLDISRMESGRIELATQTFDLHRLLHDIEALMRPQAELKALELHVRLASDLPRWLQADVQRLRQILFNLLSNAIKFSDSGSVLLLVELQPSVAWEARPGAPAPLDFTVIDTGIGMDQATLARLFQRFSQGDASITRRFGGTGLGLEISRNLARLMGGDIMVRSRPGQGSSFMVRLVLPQADEPPQACAEAVAVAPVQPEPEALPSAEAEAQCPGQSGLRILVTDDHPVNRQLMEALLSNLGHQVVLRENGAEAVELLRREMVDLVLMDVHMPVMDGLSATRAIRQLPGAAGQVRIIALTADAFSEARERAMLAGMNDFLPKPVQLGDIDQLLRRHFGMRAVVQAPAQPPPAASPPAPARRPADPEPPVETSAPRGATPAGDLKRLLDMEMIGQMMVAVGVDSYRMLLTSFLSDEHRTQAELFELLEQADDARIDRELRSAAHKLKGAAASLGLRELARQARELEQLQSAAADQPARRALAAQLRADLQLTHALCLKLEFCSVG